MAKEKVAKVPSTQKHINIAQIKNGITVTKTGLLRRVVKIQPVNFALKSEQDQTVIVGAYQNFLNSLTFPIQIIIHSRRLDVTPYLQGLQNSIEEEPNELLRFHALEYIDFIARLTSLTNIMDKEFYVVVGYDPPALTKTGILGNLFGVKEQHKIVFTATEWEKYTQELNQRTQTVANGLTALGLKAEILETQKIIELFYSVYNPEEANTEKLTDTEGLQATMVESKKNPPGSSTGVPIQNKANHLNPVTNQPASPTQRT